jgi:protein-tyrosine kinase
MSRIDEALRRAAAEATGTATGTDSLPESVLSADVGVLACEPFPESHEGETRHAPVNSAPRADVFTSVRRTQVMPTTRDSLFDRIDGRLAEKVVVDRQMEPASREQYRRLAAVLHDAQGNDGVRVVMMASAVSGEGKTLTAANLALTISESYHRRVLLIDADLRKPALHNIFKIDTTTGLSEGLKGGEAPKLVVRQISQHLWLLPAGRPNSDPMAGLTSDRMRQLIEEAKEAFDWVIIDTPPLVILPDANLLASMVDAAVLVVRAESTPHHLVKRAADAIGHKRVLGVVLNQARATHLPYGGYYDEYYYSGDTEDAERS